MDNKLIKVLTKNSVKCLVCGEVFVSKRLAEFYSGLVDERVVKALLNYTVSKDN